MALCLLLVPMLAQAAPGERSLDNVWVGMGDAQQVSLSASNRDLMPTAYNAFQLNKTDLDRILATAPEEKNTPVRNGAVLSIPMPDGRHQRFRVVESPILHRRGGRAHARVAVVSGPGRRRPHCGAAPGHQYLGFRAYGRTAQGTLWIDPYFVDASTHYLSAWKHDFAAPTGGFDCLVEDEGIAWEPDGDKAIPSSGAELTTYRMAVTLTGEYVTYFGGIPLAPIQAAITINRINAVYEVDTAIRFNLTDILAFVNAAADPFPNGSVVTSALLNQNQTALDGGLRFGQL